MRENEKSDKNKKDKAFDLQTEHTSKTALITYARLITESSFSTAVRRRQFREVSVRWY